MRIDGSVQMCQPVKFWDSIGSTVFAWEWDTFQNFSFCVTDGQTDRHLTIAITALLHTVARVKMYFFSSMFVCCSFVCLFRRAKLWDHV